MMTDDLEDKHARNRAQRLEWIDQWAEFVAHAKDDREWGDQLNELVEFQIGAVQEVDEDLLVETLLWERQTRRPGDDVRD